MPWTTVEAGALVTDEFSQIYGSLFHAMSPRPAQGPAARCGLHLSSHEIISGLWNLFLFLLLAGLS